MTDNERRQFFRIEVETPVQFRLIEEKTSKPLTDWMKGSTVDVGLGGVKITASMSKAEEETLVDKYMFIELSFQLPGAPTTIAATATIAYFLHGTAGPETTKVTFGTSFVNIDFSTRDALGEFIRQRIDSPS